MINIIFINLSLIYKDWCVRRQRVKERPNKDTFKKRFLRSRHSIKRR